MATRFLCLLFALGTPVLAQGFNVDFGDPLSAAGTPSSAFGAASGQSGVWNALDTASGGGAAFHSSPLLDTTGAMTAVTLDQTLVVGAALASYHFDEPHTTGDAAALMDDINWTNGTSTLEITGLAAGPYLLYTYCMAPDSATAVSTVDVPSSPNPLTSVSGAFAGFAPGATHAEHFVMVAAGATVTIDLDFTAEFDSLNGLQIVPLVPGNLGVVYCLGRPNANGVAAEISAYGSRFAADNDLTLTTRLLPTNTFAYYLTSQTQGLTTNPGGSSGNLCLAGQVGRYNRPGEILNSGVMGRVSLQLDLTDTPQPSGAVGVLAGETWSWQCWYRDSALGFPTSNLSSALSISLL